MAKFIETDQEGAPGDNVTTLRRIRTSGTLTMAGGAALTVGSTLVDLGGFADLPALASLGNALSAGAGLGLLFCR